MLHTRLPVGSPRRFIRARKSQTCELGRLPGLLVVLPLPVGPLCAYERVVGRDSWELVRYDCLCAAFCVVSTSPSTCPAPGSALLGLPPWVSPHTPPHRVLRPSQVCLLPSALSRVLQGPGRGPRSCSVCCPVPAVRVGRGVPLRRPRLGPKQKSLVESPP